MEKGYGWTYQVIAILSDRFDIDLDAPWKTLTKAQKQIVLYGSDKKGRGKRQRAAFEGILNTLMRRYKETSSSAMQDYYQRFLVKGQCKTCSGSRLKASARSIRIEKQSIIDLVDLPIHRLADFFNATINWSPPA